MRHSHLRDETLKMPPALKRKRGRPKNAERELGPMERSGTFKKKRKPMTCQYCFTPGHSQAHCPSKKSRAT
jgi:hypothetical protein